MTKNCIPAFGKELFTNMFIYQHNCINPKSRRIHMQPLNTSTLYRSAAILHPNMDEYQLRQGGAN